MLSFRPQSIVTIAAVGVALLLLGTSPSLAAKPIFTETYNIPQQPCEGLDLDGVVYSFTVAGAPVSIAQLAP